MYSVAAHLESCGVWRSREMGAGGGWGGATKHQHHGLSLLQPVLSKLMWTGGDSGWGVGGGGARGARLRGTRVALPQNDPVLCWNTWKT